MNPNPERYVWAEHRSLFAKEPELFLAGPYPTADAAREAVKSLAGSLGTDLWDWHIATLKGLPQPLFIWTTWDHGNHNAPPWPILLIEGKPQGLKGVLLGLWRKLAERLYADRAKLKRGTPSTQGG